MQRKRPLGKNPNLSEEVVTLLREQLVSGTRPPDSRLNEVQLAAELEVSRTPLREALNQLVVEGLVTAIPRRGFFVKPLTEEDLEHLYSIRALLDPAALRLGGIPDGAQLDRLDAINQRIASASGATRIVDLDDAWHLALLSHCPNPILIELIEQFIHRTRRYELAYMNHNRNVSVAIDEHERIVGSLRQGRLEDACAALFQNMQSAVEPIKAWLRSAPAKETNS